MLETVSRTQGLSPIETYLRALHARHSGLTDGHVADYIPELAKANPDWFGICIATRDGHVYEVGDTRQAFTIQSISKALAYGLSLEDRGEDYILNRIGVEPSGDAFNAISLKPETGAPFNPMINAGAIATCGQVRRTPEKSRIQRIVDYLSACAGRSLAIDQAVYRSESETGHRNRAIGWMLRNFDIIEEEPTDILETYFQQCAISVTCRDLALIGATLANQGCNPLTRERAIAPAYVDNILSVMSTCGMYDFSGEWIYRVGLPAKSGVGGGILAVLPGQLGIGLFSPPLDAQGNSARGIRACADLSRDLSLHLFSNTAAPPSAIRLNYDGSQVNSRRRRTPTALKTLRGAGHRIRVMELQGDLNFSSVEPVIRSALKQAPYCQYLILNFRNVGTVDPVALRLLGELHSQLAHQGVQLHGCEAGRLERSAPHAPLREIPLHADDDAALEHCENDLLRTLLGADWDAVPAVSLSKTQLLHGLDPEDMAWLEREMPKRTAEAEEYLMRTGEAGDRLYLLLSGTVEVRLTTPEGQPGKRIGVFVAGMSFGEMALIDGSPRSADVIALTRATYAELDQALFTRLDTERPQLKIQVLQRLARQISENLRRTNQEMAAFKS